MHHFAHIVEFYGDRYWSLNSRTTYEIDSHGYGAMYYLNRSHAMFDLSGGRI